MTDENGIHARPAGLLVKLAANLKSTMIMHKGEKMADLKRLFAIMGLCVKKGDTIEITFEGEDENEAYEVVSKFLKENF